MNGRSDTIGCQLQPSVGAGVLATPRGAGLSRSAGVAQPVEARARADAFDAVGATDLREEIRQGITS